MNHDRVVAVIAIVLVVLIGGGELALIVDGHNGYSSQVTFDQGQAYYSLISDGSNSYDVVGFANGGFAPNSGVFVYYDDSIASCVVSGGEPLGSRELDQAYYVEQLIKNLAIRGIKATIIDASELMLLMTASESTTAAIICVSGALPYTVYTGSASDPIFNWLSNGGRLYWLGNYLGSYSAYEWGVSPVWYGESLFYGAFCLNHSETTYANEAYEGNSLRTQLSVQNNNVRYAVNPTVLSAATTLALGYEQDGYVSIVLSAFGSGQICTFGGDYSYAQIEDVAQVVASGICFCSQVVGSVHGNMARETVSGTMDGTVAGDGQFIVYVYYGGFRPIYGQAFISA